MRSEVQGNCRGGFTSPHLIITDTNLWHELRSGSYQTAQPPIIHTLIHTPHASKERMSPPPLTTGHRL